MFTEYLAWYSETWRRTSGALPASGTLTAKRYRLESCARLVGADKSEHPAMTLCALLERREDVEALVSRLHARLHPGTVVATLVCLRSLGEYGKAMGWIRGHEIRPTDSPARIPTKPITVYGQDELDLILLVAKARHVQPHFWAFLMVLVETGRRVSEVNGLEWERLHLDTDVPHFDLRHTKMRRQEYVPLTRRLREEVFTAEIVAEMKASPNPLWGKDSEVFLFPWLYAAGQEQLRRVCAIARVPYRGFHVFRHTKATRMLARGVPIQAVSALLGHASVQTTDRIYNHATALSYVNYVDE